MIPDSHEDKILNSLNKIDHLLSRYFIGLLFQLFIVFVLYLIVLVIFGVENAIVIAFLCGVLNIVPYIGPLIASVLAAILTMIHERFSWYTQVYVHNDLAGRERILELHL